MSLATAACVPTPFTPGVQSGFNAFGMGFSADTVGTGETLYVAAAEMQEGSVLGTVDTTSLALSTIGAFNPSITLPELTGTGDGRLFAFYSTNDTRTSSAIAQIDKTTGNITGQDLLPNVPQGDAWAFGFWGGDFYLFTAPEPEEGVAATETIVTHYSLTDKSVTQVATYPELIVGAGVSTCAPER